MGVPETAGKEEEKRQRGHPRRCREWTRTVLRSLSGLVVDKGETVCGRVTVVVGFRRSPPEWSHVRGTLDTGRHVLWRRGFLSVVTSGAVWGVEVGEFSVLVYTVFSMKRVIFFFHHVIDRPPSLPFHPPLTSRTPGVIWKLDESKSLKLRGQCSLNNWSSNFGGLGSDCFPGSPVLPSFHVLSFSAPSRRFPGRPSTTDVTVGESLRKGPVRGVPPGEGKKRLTVVPLRT